MSFQVSHLPHYAMAVQSDQNQIEPSYIVAVAGADHMIHQLQLNTGHSIPTIRQLYVSAPNRNLKAQRATPHPHHSDWITALDFCRDGRLLSGSQDCRLILWPKYHRTSNTHDEKQNPILLSPGHQASISDIKTIHQSGSMPELALASSYDGSISVWSLNDPNGPVRLSILAGEQLKMDSQRYDSTEQLLSDVLPPTRQKCGGGFSDLTRSPAANASKPPVMKLFLPATETTSQNIFSYTRTGQVNHHNLTTSQLCSTIQAHCGPLSSLHTLDCNLNSIVTSGGEDGFVRCFDLRLPPERGRCVGKYAPAEDNGQKRGISCMVHVSNNQFGLCRAGLGAVEFVDVRGGTTGKSSSRSKSITCMSLVHVREGSGMGFLGLNVRVGAEPGWSTDNLRHRVIGYVGPMTLKPSHVAYSMLPLISNQDGNGVVVGWGDGATTAIDGIQTGSLKVTELKRPTGIHNSIRCLQTVSIEASKVQHRGYRGKSEFCLVGAGDDGRVVVWD